MALLKCSLTVLFVTCLSVSADPLKLKPQTLNISPAKNAQPQVADEAKPNVVPIYLYSRENSLDGDYNFRYETGNGIFAEERGVMLNKGTEDEANSVVGSYRYVSPEGVPIEVTYTAGVDGFRAYGAHLPVAPPAAVLPKNLAYKNVAQGPFARPQFRAAADDSDVPAAELRTADDDGDDDQQAASQSVRNSAGSPPSGGSGRPTAQSEAEAAADELPEKPVILLVGGDEQPTANKPLSQSPTAANEVEQPQQKVDPFFDIKKPLAAEYYQQFDAPTPTTSLDQLAQSTQSPQDQSVFSSSATSLPAQQRQQPQQKLQQQQQQEQQQQQQQEQQQQQQQQVQQQQQQQLQQQQQHQQVQQQQQHQQVQQRLPSVEQFEPPKSVVSVVPALQTVAQGVQTQPKVVPVLQRVVPGGNHQQYQQQQQQQQQQQYQQQQQQQYQRQLYQQQQQQPYQQQAYQQQPYLQPPYQQQKPYQQQPRFNARPFPPTFGQRPRPVGSLRQFSVEPQQMWYVPQNQEHTRYFQMPTVPRTMEPPKY